MWSLSSYSSTIDRTSSKKDVPASVSRNNSLYAPEALRYVLPVRKIKKGIIKVLHLKKFEEIMKIKKGWN